MVNKLRTGRYLYIEANPKRSSDALSAFPYRIVLRGSGNNIDYEVAYVIVQKTPKGFSAGPFLLMRKYDAIPTILLQCKTESYARGESRFKLRVLALKIAMKDKSIEGIVDGL